MYIICRKGGDITQFYADTYFVYTLAADYAVIMAAACIWGRGGRIFWRIFLLDMLCVLFIALFGLYAVLSYIALAAAVIFCLKPKRISEFFAMLLTVYIVSFGLGSAALGFMCLFGANEFVMLIPAFLLIFVSKRIAKNRRLSELTGIYPLVLDINGRTAAFDALADSGNALKVNGAPVIIVDKTAAAEILPYIRDEFFTECVSVTGRKKLMCFYAKARIGEKYIENACIAVSAEKIEGGFNALFNAEMLK
ncbi:MAG: sigma-E processing peptidase SpoIIGA [Firmicutes bacterium]|nr:sigma-E processing peptidase SpoIIGA [Bacillota bacterium]